MGLRSLRQSVDLTCPKERLVTDLGDAIHNAVRGAVVIGGIVLGAAVIAENDAIFLPDMRTGKSGSCA
jgi:hypothetical protein